MGQCDSSTHSEPRHKMEVICKFHVFAVLPSREESALGRLLNGRYSRVENCGEDKIQSLW